MSRTVTALYDTRAEAEAARDRLSSEVDVEGRAKIIDKSSAGSSDFHSVPLSHEDRHAYSEGLNRGGFMLCAEVDEDEDADRIVALLEQTSSVDMDERQDSWRTEGWQPYAGTSGSGSAFFGGEDRDRDRAVEEERIPIVEEHLNVGKREVSRGGARVRSYVKETPVNEQVNLREEHVSVERRPVTGDSSRNLGEGAFEERNIEMRETAEVPVVEKEARVAEELVVRKTAEEHTENVQGTVRRTEVDVDETSGRDRDRDI
ncbi:MAG TPA: YsnF/AvaK domain-containing protein [Allosphingosinicella sp.]|nr:YsnF/AvaK domain-containing protein [Allosphingosinicella sp.]